MLALVSLVRRGNRQRVVIPLPGVHVHDTISANAVFCYLCYTSGTSFANVYFI